MIYSIHKINQKPTRQPNICKYRQETGCSSMLLPNQTEKHDISHHSNHPLIPRPNDLLQKTFIPFVVCCSRLKRHRFHCGVHAGTVATVVQEQEHNIASTPATKTEKKGAFCCCCIIRNHRLCRCCSHSYHPLQPICFLLFVVV